MVTLTRLVFLLILAPWVLVSCAAPVIKTEMLAPARFPAAANIREIAVLPFDGPNGKIMTKDIADTLAGITLEDKPYFKVADSAQVEKILQEQGFTQPSIMGEAAVAQVGKLLGVKGVYTGVVTAMAVKNAPFTETRKTCVQVKTGYEYRYKSPEDRCAKWDTYPMECLKKDGVVSFSARLISVESGTVVYRTAINEDAGSSTCLDSKTPPPAEEELVIRAKDRAKLTFRKEVAPSFIIFDTPLMESKEGLASKEAEQKLAQGVESVKQGRLDRACELWEAGSKMAPQSPSLIYNLAVCAEAREDWKASADLYKKAEQTLGKPDDRITWGLERVSEKQKSLKDQIK